jgi:hypothetical protein
MHRSISTDVPNTPPNRAIGAPSLFWAHSGSPDRRPTHLEPNKTTALLHRSQRARCHLGASAPYATSNFTINSPRGTFGIHTPPTHPHLASHPARFAIAADMPPPRHWPPLTTIHHPLVPLSRRRPLAAASRASPPTASSRHHHLFLACPKGVC